MLKPEGKRARLRACASHEPSQFGGYYLLASESEHAIIALAFDHACAYVVTKRVGILQVRVGPPCMDVTAILRVDNHLAPRRTWLGLLGG